jgi:GNAT superfamily N-acetyltransferase
MSTPSLTFANPNSINERLDRDKLLALSLRETDYQWAYASEYPLVLTDDAKTTSWCVYSHGDLVAHANLWPRQLRHSNEEKSYCIGLVGNVATHPDHRGQGHMKALLSYLAEIAPSQNLHALVLWSDMLGFYQNFGFRSIGREMRLRVPRSERLRSTGIERCEASRLSDQELAVLLNSRPRIEWTLDRSIGDFRALLGIPDTQLFIRRKGQKPVSWILIGKGADMRGVIHEWGAPSADELIADVHSVLQLLDISDLLLLCPGNLPHHWLAPLKLRAVECSPHHMALALGLGSHSREALNALSKGFIWGLDSI